MAAFVDNNSLHKGNTAVPCSELVYKLPILGRRVSGPSLGGPNSELPSVANLAQPGVRMSLKGLGSSLVDKRLPDSKNTEF